ncbi:MAG: IS1634 family transposase [bacterium]
MKHTQHGRITGCTLEQLKILQIAFREQVVPQGDPDAFEILESREYGASYALMALAKQLGLPQCLSARSTPWVKPVLAMIVGRLVFAGSKLSLCNQATNTCLWELTGVEEKPDVDVQCYPALDQLLARQRQIQKNLARRHLASGHLILYDITSVYFEGAYNASDLVKFGYNRDRKKGFEQIVVGLICNGEGCPVGVEVYAGNTKDETTVVDKIRQIRDDFGIEKIVFVGDRGMVTESTVEALKDDDELHLISALTHGGMRKLLEKKVIQLDLFDEHLTHEVSDPDKPGQRYCLCRNPVTAERETQTRKRLLELTEKELKKIANYKQKASVEKLGARVGKVLAKYKMGKFIPWSIEADATHTVSRDHHLSWHIDDQKVDDEKRFDGCYIISTDVDKAAMDTDTVVHAYKQLTQVERAFRNLKTVQLEIRPVYHKTDERIRAHVFLCMLAYYLQWHFEQRLAPLFEGDGEGPQRRWTLQGVIDCLKQITRNRVQTQGVEFYQNSRPNEEQQTILDLLGVTM